MTTRRSFLGLLGAVPAGLRVLPHPGRNFLDPPSPPTASGVLDSALERLAPYAPSYRGGLSNHGPMAAEALVALGYPDRVLAWLEGYCARLEARPATGRRIQAANWQEALGQRSRSRDWEGWFENELAEAPWQDVLGRWLPRLAPGIAAAGLHGVIRVGHAASSLAIVDNGIRRNELARALGYWAAEYRTLPGEPGEPGTLTPSEALAAVEQLPQDRRRSRGLITTELGDLGGFPAFENVMELVDPGAGHPSFLIELHGELAGALTRTRAHSFEFLHGVTGIAALQELVPYVDHAERATTLLHGWQAIAALVARYGSNDLFEGPSPLAPGADLKALSAQAVRSGDEHTIKLAAACADGWRRTRDPRFLAALRGRFDRGR